MSYQNDTICRTTIYLWLQEAFTMSVCLSPCVFALAQILFDANIRSSGGHDMRKLCLNGIGLILLCSLTPSQVFANQTATAWMYVVNASSTRRESGTGSAYLSSLPNSPSYPLATSTSSGNANNGAYANAQFIRTWTSGGWITICKFYGDCTSRC